jgi:O-antigen ligase
MLDASKNKVGIQIGLCLFLVTIVVWTSGLSEPVGMPKLAVLTTCTIAIFASNLLNLRMIYSSQKALFISCAFFVLWLGISSFMSPNPISRSFYGVEARNTGWLTYFALALLAISTTLLTTHSSFKYVYIAFLSSAGINIIYGLYVIGTGKDPIPWNNIYGTILGTFGNPNFISSFLGFSVPIFIVIALSSEIRIWVRVVTATVIPVTLFEIIKTHSIQGVVVAALGTSLLIGLKLRYSKINQNLTKLYLCALFASGTMAIFGMLQKGPLTLFLYKDSVSYRGEYWSAGFRMIKDNPIFGLGPDSYGNWYRFYRDSSAIIRPGLETTANTAHNVFIDIGVNGGIPVLVAYIFICSLVVLKIIRTLKSSINLDRTFWSFAIIWICYQVQSLISINQIGLAVWGWALTGVILAYPNSTEKSDSPISTPNRSKRKNVKIKADSGLGVVFGTIGFALGLVAVVPPLSADHAWRKGLEVSDANVLDQALEKWPQESNRLVIGSSIFANNKLNDFAIKFARQSVKHDPNHFDSWRNLSRTPGATKEEIAKALKEMKRLDPLNLDPNKKQ